MTWDEFWGDFDPHYYAKTLSGLGRDELRTTHANLRRQTLAARTRAGAGLVGFFHTAGLSLIATGINFRRQQYLSRKVSIIEAHMRREGWSPTEMPASDIFMAMGPTAVIHSLAPVAGDAVGHIVNHAAGQFFTHAAGDGATTYAAHHTADMASSALHHPADFAHAAGQGAVAQLGAVGHQLEGHATQLVPTDSIADGTTAFLGNTAGQAGAKALELEGIDWLAGKGTREGIDAYVRAKTPKGGTISGQKGMAGRYMVEKGKDARVQATVPHRDPVSGQKSERLRGTVAVLPILLYWYLYWCGSRWYKMLAILPLLVFYYKGWAIIPIVWYWYGMGEHWTYVLIYFPCFLLTAAYLIGVAKGMQGDG